MKTLHIREWSEYPWQKKGSDKGLHSFLSLISGKSHVSNTKKKKEGMKARRDDSSFILCEAE